MTLEDNVKEMLGRLMLQLAQAQTEIQRLGKELADLKAAQKTE